MFPSYTSICLIVLLLRLQCIVTGHHHYCGRPAVPENGQINSEKISFHNNESVIFACNGPQYILMGSSFSTCQDNETWAPPSPTCERNVAYEINTKNTYNDIKVFDGKRDTCTNLNVTRKLENAKNNNILLEIRLERTFTVEKVLFYLSGTGNYYSLIVGVWGKNSDIALCGTFEGEIFHKTKPLNCEQPIVGNTIVIMSDRPLAQNICEIIVLTKEEKKCGYPEIPYHSDFSWTKQGVSIQYSCKSGFNLLGQSSVACQNGRWDPPPRCLHTEDICGFPGAPTNGFANPNKLAYSSNTLVTYTCLPDFLLIGSINRVCQENGSWTNQVPKCERNIALKEVTFFENKKSAILKYFNDGDKQTCAKIEAFDSKDYMKSRLIVELPRKFKIIEIALTFKGKYSLKAAIEDNNLTTICFDKQGELDIGNLNVSCQNDSAFGNKVILQNSAKSSLVLCEIEIASVSDESCGSPEVPLHATVINSDDTYISQRVEYKCSDNYSVQGPHTRLCNNGIWEPLRTTCKKIQIEATKGPRSTESGTEPNHHSNKDDENENKNSNELNKFSNEIMAIIIGVVAASLTILCSIVIIVLIMKKCNFKGSASAPNQGNKNPEFPPEWDEASMHYYDSVKSDGLPSCLASSRSTPVDNAYASISLYPVHKTTSNGPYYHELENQSSSTGSNPETWYRQQLQNNMTTTV